MLTMDSQPDLAVLLSVRNEKESTNQRERINKRCQEYSTDFVTDQLFEWSATIFFNVHNVHFHVNR